MKPKMSVGRCCCDAADCIYCEDNFNRGDSSDIDNGSDCGWTEESGNPTIASNELSFPAAGIATSDTTQAGSEPKIYVLVDAECASLGDTARIIFNFVDTSNYDYFEMKAGAASAGSIRLVTVSGGTPTTVIEQTSITIPTAVMHTLCFAYTGGHVVGTWVEGGGGSGFETVSDEDVTQVNGVVGLGTDSGCLFDDFSFQKHESFQSGCPDCTVECVPCSGNAPAFFLVTLALIADDICTDCDDATTGFNKQFVVGYSPGGIFDCRWQREIGLFGTPSTGESPACAVGPLGASNTLQVGAIDDGANTDIQVWLSINAGASGTQIIKWIYEGSSGYEDCLTYSEKDIPFDSETGTARCDGSSSTCKVTAI